MKSFGFVTISYKRPQVLRLFGAGIRRLRQELDTFIPCVCVGDVEHKDICDEYQLHHIPHENHPASRKWNVGVEYLMGIGMDYVVVVGSDDLLSTDLVKNLISAMDKGYDLIGISTIYFYGGNGQHRGRMRKLVSPKTILGVARTIKRDIIEKAKPMWRKDKSWAMDGDCLRNIMPFVKTVKIVEGDCFDIKTSENLNKITMWMSKLSLNHPPEVLLNILSEEEKELLSAL